MQTSYVAELYAWMIIAELQYECALKVGWDGEELYAIKAALNAARFRYASALESNLTLTDTGVKETI